MLGEEDRIERRAWFVAGFALALAGCGRYAEFRLPSPDGEAGPVQWTAVDARREPVLGRGPAGDFDSVDALNPSVVRRNGVYYNFYSGFDGRTWHTGLATSADGIEWARQGRVLSPESSGWEGGYIAANGSALAEAGGFLYWYQAGGRTPRIGLARSRDGRSWTREPQPVIELGPRGSWDERAVADPYVIRAGGKFYMYYLGQDRARRQRLGVAESADGVRWVKLRSNPILELGEPGAFDEVGLGEPAVWAQAGWYWMLYTGRDRKEYRRIGLARSRDGVRWERVPFVFEGGEPWNSRVVCDPHVEAGETVRVWYGGGDAARPDERLNGQIGLFHLRASR
jgi:predicted GH43/DUF377 family glycosyl hydrolase